MLYFKNHDTSENKGILPSFPNSELSKFSHKQATIVGLVLIAPGGDGRRGKCGLQSTTDRRLLIALGVHLCVQRDGRLGVRQRHACLTL